MAEDGSLTVYKYGLDAARSSNDNISRSPEMLLKQGRHLVNASLIEKGWTTVSVPSNRSLISRLDAGPSLVYNTPPPPVTCTGCAITTECISRSDRVDRLPEFKGVDFSYLLDRNKLAEVDAESRKRASKRDNGDFSISEVDNAESISHAQSERKKCTENVSLHDLVPSPHHYPCSEASSARASQNENEDITKAFLPHMKAPFTALRGSPYSLKNAQTYLQSPSARCAWIVPISGALPWPEASHAQLLLSPSRHTDDAALVVEETLSNSPVIHWYKQALHQFWSDLLEMRNIGFLGPLAITYRVARSTRVSPTEIISLAESTYIEIGHDVRLALYMRKVLDAWRANIESEAKDENEELHVGAEAKAKPAGAIHDKEAASLPADSELRKTSVRPLLGARLVLVDEANQAVGLC